MGEELNKPPFSQRCLQTFFIFLSRPRARSHGLLSFSASSRAFGEQTLRAVIESEEFWRETVVM